MVNLICRYKLFNLRKGFQSRVLLFYQRSTLVIIVLSIRVAIYLYRLYFFVGLELASLNNSWFSLEIKSLSYIKLYKALDLTGCWIWLTFHNITLGLSKVDNGIYGLELSYSHKTLVKIFKGLFSIHSSKLGHTVCLSLILGIITFINDYSARLMNIMLRKSQSHILIKTSNF